MSGPNPIINPNMTKVTRCDELVELHIGLNIELTDEADR